MAKSLAQLQSQIAKLQKEAEAIRAKEVSGVVQRIREAISHYSLTPEDLFGPTAKAGRRKKAVAGKKPAASDGGKTKGAASPVKGRKVPVKYRDSAGNSWTGRGSKPRWVVAALASGKSLDDFAIAK